MVEQKIQKKALQRPAYGTGRMAAILTKVLGVAINMKEVQIIFKKLSYITPAKSKKEIRRSKMPNVKANRPNQVWEADLSYVPCDIDGWGCLFNVFDVFTREGLVTVLIYLQSRKMQ